MEVNTWHVNFNYESQLETGNIQPEFSRTNSEFEYLIFFHPPEHEYKLLSKTGYPPDYLDWIKSLGLPVPELVVSAHNPRTWWGNLENLEIARKWNSKNHAVRLARRYHLDTVPCFLEGEKLPNDGRIMLKRREYSFSGIGYETVVASSTDRIHKHEIYSELKDRVLDLGHGVSRKGVVSWLNLVDDRMKWKGAVFPGSPGMLSSWLLDKYSLDLKMYQVKLKKIFDDQNEVDFFQVDSFVYREKENFRHDELVEINMRRSMGSLWSDTPWIRKKWAGVFVLPNKPEQRKLAESFEDFMILTPNLPGYRFILVLVQSDSLEKLLAFQQ